MRSGVCTSQCDYYLFIFSWGFSTVCHSSVIIRKHIDLTITVEQHSPAPQTGYLSPGGTWSDEAGSELILRLRFTPPAVFAPPLAPLYPFTSFFPLPLLYSLLISCSTSLSHSAFCLLRFCRPCSAAMSAAPASCSVDMAAAPSTTARVRLHAGGRSLMSIPASLPTRSCEGCSRGGFLAEAFSTQPWRWQEVAIPPDQGCLWTWRVGFASSPPKVCEQLNLFVLLRCLRREQSLQGRPKGVP